MANGWAFSDGSFEAFVGGASPVDLEKRQLCFDAISEHHVQLYFGTSKPLSCCPVEEIQSPRRQTLNNGRKKALRDFGGWFADGGAGIGIVGRGAVISRRDRSPYQGVGQQSVRAAEAAVPNKALLPSATASQQGCL
ncbi:hypothetical protein TgHK011_005679 [Trichoderma gracile]|nr:hypothetical protein TgHK011_005679 [Trichoderma gracile]